MMAIDEIQSRYGTEIALTILCCRLHFNTEKKMTLQQFIDRHTIDWPQLHYLSAYHKVRPIVYKMLAAIQLPQPVAEAVKKEQLRLVQQSFRRAIETERLILQLKNHGIGSVPYKGVAFSKQFYGDIISRESSDIDLVIAPDVDFGSIIDLMEKDGYVFEHHIEYAYFGKQIFEQKKDLSFNKYDGDTREFHIEFHWKVLDKFHHVNKRSDDLLYNYDREIVLAKEQLKVINSANHYVAIMLHHAYSDGISHLRNIMDVAQLNLASSEIDRTRIISLLGQLDLYKASDVFRYLCEELVGITLPYHSNTNIAQKEKQYFTRQLLHSDMINHHYQTKFYYKNRLFLRNSATDRLKYLWGCLQLRVAPSRKDLRIFRLPHRLGFLYALLKPFRSVISPLDINEEKRITGSKKA